jgi:hypothetical protein
MSTAVPRAGPAHRDPHGAGPCDDLGRPETTGRCRRLWIRGREQFRPNLFILADHAPRYTLHHPEMGTDRLQKCLQEALGHASECFGEAEMRAGTDAGPLSRLEGIWHFGPMGGTGGSGGHPRGPRQPVGAPLTRRCRADLSR